MDWSEVNQISCLPVSGLPGPMKSFFPPPSVLYYAISLQICISNEWWWLCEQHVMLRLCSGPQGTTALFPAFPLVAVFTWTSALTARAVSQSASLTAMHSQQASVEKRPWQAQKWFLNPAFFIIYIKVYDPPSWLKVMEGGGGCQMHSACYMAQFFYFEWWGYRFLVHKVGH